MKKAVCALLINSTGQILGVSRRNKPQDMNLPGGKVDPGETPEEACIREVWEETGLKLSELELVYNGLCAGDVDYDCYCYYAEYEGEPQAGEEGLTVRWITWNDLLQPSNSFYDYNQRLFQKMRGYGQRS